MAAAAVYHLHKIRVECDIRRRWDAQLAFVCPAPVNCGEQTLASKSFEKISKKDVHDVYCLRIRASLFSDCGYR